MHPPRLFKSKTALEWCDPVAPRSEPKKIAQILTQNEFKSLLHPGDAFIWIGSAPDRWVAVRMGDHAFQSSFSASCDLPSGHPLAWSDRAGCLDLLARACFERAECCPERILTDPLTEGTSQSPSHSGEYAARFYIVPLDQLDACALALISGVPGSRRLSARGGPSSRAIDEARSHAFVPKIFFLSYFEKGQGAGIHPYTIVDGLQRVWAFWLPAGARAMGCPPPLSVCEEGIDGAISLMAVLRTAERTALEDPEQFKVDFSEAIIEVGPSSLSFDSRKAVPHLLAALPDFLARDRRCLLASSTALASAVSPKVIRL